MLAPAFIKLVSAVIKLASVFVKLAPARIKQAPASIKLAPAINISASEHKNTKTASLYFHISYRIQKHTKNTLTID